MKNWIPFLCSFLFPFYLSIDAKQPDNSPNASGSKSMDQPCVPSSFQGWSFDLGGQYTWMLFSTPPTFSGSTGGVHGSITYQKADSLFAQIRSYWNGGRLTATGQTSQEKEFYTDLLAGYCFLGWQDWLITPYLGFGFDYLNDSKSATALFSPINLKYRIHYVVAGLDVRYLYGRDWVFGGQIECLPTFQQYLSIVGLPGDEWKMEERIGWTARLPFAYRLVDQLWLEAAPYYRYLPIGSSSVLSLPHRSLNEVGGLVTFRFFL